MLTVEKIKELFHAVDEELASRGVIGEIGICRADSIEGKWAVVGVRDIEALSLAANEFIRRGLLA